MLTDNHAFIKVRVILIFCTSTGVPKKPSPRLLINLCSLINFVGTWSAHQWVRVIPSQIFMVKQVNIYVYSIEVRYMLLMYIANSLHARVYWLFDADLQLLLKLCASAKGCNMLNSGNFGYFARKPNLHANNKGADQHALTRLCYSLSIT